MSKTITLNEVENNYGALSQGRDPFKDAPRGIKTGGSGVTPKPPKAKSAGVANRAGFNKVKYAKQPKPLDTGRADPGRPEKAPTSKSMKSGNGGGMKTVKAPDMAVKKGYKSAMPAAPAAIDVAKATMKMVKTAVAKDRPTPKSGKITVSEPRFIKPDFGFGVLPVGSVLKFTGAKGKKINESVVNGAVHMRVGGQVKLVLEAASMKKIREVALGFSDTGLDVEVETVIGHRTAYSDRVLRERLAEWAHAVHHGRPSFATDAMRMAKTRMSQLLEREKPNAEDLSEALAQAASAANVAYLKNTTLYEATIRFKDESEEDVYVRAVDERHAADLASRKAAEARGVGAKQKWVVVEGVKHLPESDESLFKKMPKPFEDLFSGKRQSPPASKKVRQSEPPALKKPATLSIGGKLPKGVVQMKSTTVPKDPSNLVDREGKKVDYQKSNLKQQAVKKDTGPIYEEDTSQDETEGLDPEALRALADEIDGKTTASKRQAPFGPNKRPKKETRA